MRREQISQFVATGSDGATYMVKVFRDVSESGDAFDVNPLSNDPAEWKYVASVPGIDIGHRLVRVKRGNYTILDTTITLTSADPNAP